MRWRDSRGGLLSSEIPTVRKRCGTPAAALLRQTMVHRGGYRWRNTACCMQLTFFHFPLVGTRKGSGAGGIGVAAARVRILVLLFDGDGARRVHVRRGGGGPRALRRSCMIYSKTAQKKELSSYAVS